MKLTGRSTIRASHARNRPIPITGRSTGASLDLAQHNVSLHVSDGELYTGTVADYRGTRTVISRHLSEGSHVDLKLDDTLGWLEGKITFFVYAATKANRVRFD